MMLARRNYRCQDSDRCREPPIPAQWTGIGSFPELRQTSPVRPPHEGRTEFRTPLPGTPFSFTSQTAGSHNSCARPHPSALHTRAERSSGPPFPELRSRSRPKRSRHGSTGGFEIHAAPRSRRVCVLPGRGGRDPSGEERVARVGGAGSPPRRRSPTPSGRGGR